MTRYLCWLAVLGVAAVPDWASACRPTGGGEWYPVPVYAPPVYVVPACPPPVFVAPPPCYPYPAPVLPPPRVEPGPRMAVPNPAPPPGAMGTNPGLLPGRMPPARPPAVEPIRPAGGSDTPVSPPAAPAPRLDPPAPDLKLPVVEIPKGLQLDPKPRSAADPPKADDPKPPAPKPSDDPPPAPKLPPLELPKEPANTAVPGPAPAPDPVIPPPAVPLMPDAKKPTDLPPLILPPDAPPKTDSTSRSSPLTGERKRELSVNVFPASGSGRAANGYRTVGFYNHTGRDLALTIEGRAVKLPARTYLHAQLGPTFTWSHGDGPATRETVPDGASGLEVVFRD